MIFIPPKVKISATIKQGSVYYFVQSHFKPPEPHYFVVLNKDPFESTLLIVVNATSNIVGRQSFIRSRGFSPETLVVVTPTDCTFLKRESVFDCNFPGVYTPQELLKRCEADVFKYSGDISLEVLNKLKKGFLASKLVKEELKLLV